MFKNIGTMEESQHKSNVLMYILVMVLFNMRISSKNSMAVGSNLKCGRVFNKADSLRR